MEQMLNDVTMKIKKNSLSKSNYFMSAKNANAKVV